jgi:hypothetical protein
VAASNGKDIQESKYPESSGSSKDGKELETLRGRGQLFRRSQETTDTTCLGCALASVLLWPQLLPVRYSSLLVLVRVSSSEAKGKPTNNEYHCFLRVVVLLPLRRYCLYLHDAQACIGSCQSYYPYLHTCRKYNILTCKQKRSVSINPVGRSDSFSRASGVRAVRFQFPTRPAPPASTEASKIQLHRRYGTSTEDPRPARSTNASRPQQRRHSALASSPQLIWRDRGDLLESQITVLYASSLPTD